MVKVVKVAPKSGFCWVCSRFHVTNFGSLKGALAGGFCELEMWVFRGFWSIFDALFDFTPPQGKQGLDGLAGKKAENDVLRDSQPPCERRVPSCYFRSKFDKIRLKHRNREAKKYPKMQF